MIDLHCHFLPGIDDGPQTLTDALILAKAAVADGIKAAVVTPHVHPGRYDNRLETLLHNFQAFKAALVAEDIPLEVFLGGEVRFGIESLEWIAEEQVPFLGEVAGYRILLLEFPHGAIPVGALQLVERLMAMRIRPMIAHPERNKTIMGDVDRLGQFLDAGCWLQITAGSLTGRFGPQAEAVARRIVRNQWAHVLATDAHNLSHRPPCLAEGLSVALEILGNQAASDLVFSRPAEILGLR